MEYFPENVHLYRKERSVQRSGEVFIAIHRNLISEEEFDLNTDCEIMWDKISIAGCKHLHLCFYYIPDVNDEYSLEHIEVSIGRMNGNQHTFIAGDVNFPGWDWENEVLKKVAKMYPFTKHFVTFWSCSNHRHVNKINDD